MYLHASRMPWTSLVCRLSISTDWLSSLLYTVKSCNIKNCAIFCSWGPSFGLQGNFKIAYGAAYIMPPDYTFAMQFGPDSTAAAAAAISKQLKGCFVQDQQNQRCLLYRPNLPTRLVTLADMLGVLALHASVSGGASAPSRADILADLVLSNLGVVADLAAVTKPGKVVKVCGSSIELLAGLVQTPNPDTQVRRACYYLL
jgi:hypothetical protein